MKLLNPKNDVVFQKLFGNNKNKDVLISFLNSIIIKTGNEEIIDAHVEEKKLDISMVIDEKISILDIYVTTNTNAHINVEMQIINRYNMIKRTLFYWSKMFLKQIVKGDNYSSLNKTITINLVDFNFLDSERFHTYYHLYEDESKSKLTDIMEIHFIELKKFKDGNKDLNDKLHKWVSFFNDPSDEEVTHMAEMDKDIRKAKDILSLISSDKEVQQLAEMREKALLDYNSNISGAREEGEAKGRAEEKEKIAVNILDLADDETIAKKTGLAVQFVKELRANHMKN